MLFLIWLRILDVSNHAGILATPTVTKTDGKKGMLNWKENKKTRVWSNIQLIQIQQGENREKGGRRTTES